MRCDMRYVSAAFAALSVLACPAATLCRSSSAAVKVNQASGARVAAASEAIRYSAAWETTASGATAVVAVNGTTLKSATGTGSVTWTPTRNGTYTLTHKVMNGSTQVGSTLSATFTVAGIYPANPTISPATETKFVGSQEVTLACGTAGATIYYTLDGSEPTMESLVYSGPFSVTETTTVIARAFFENGDASLETVTATYILNKVATPEISPASGSTFTDSQTVTISCSTEGAAIYYTTDGSDPTSESTVYRRFRISGRTVVKAIAYVDGMAVSDVASAEYALGRCTDPVIVSAGGETFQHSDNLVTIKAAREGSAGYSEDQVLRYTTDGSEPTAESPVYEGSFAISESMVVKAKVFSDSFFDSAVVTANLVREWVAVDTPVIVAVDSFSGSKAKVKITCGTPDAVVRYTLNGNDPNSHSTKYTGPFVVSEGSTVKAYAVLGDYLNSAVAVKTVVKVRGIGDAMGAPDHAFATGGDADFSEVTDATASLGVSMKSGAIGDEQKSVLSTTVMGSGTLSFKWKTSCESDPYHEWDHVELAVDGEVVAWLDGMTDWTPVSQRIEGEGEHAVTWTYRKDDAESDGEDCAWVTDYAWQSDFTATQTTDVPVPYAWLKANCLAAVDEYEAYENLAKSRAENGVNTVEECYVAGFDPESATAALHAGITMDDDGKPVVTWSPDLNEGAGKVGARAYTIMGSNDLETWSEVADGTEGNFHFFKVKVSMP